MVKYVFFLILVVVAWVYVLWDESQQEGLSTVETPKVRGEEAWKNTDQEKTEKTPPKMKINGNKTPLKTVLKKLPNGQAIQQKYKDLRKENLAEFKVEEGKVIGFGDVLLGETDEKIDRGFTYMEPLQYWRDGIIPYGIDVKVQQKELIEEVISYFNELRIIKFVPYQGQKDYLVFTIGEKNCYSYLGKIGGPQPIFLSPTCQRGSIIHEIMHALGFIHEHSRADRDRYIEVNWENIDETYHEQFAYGSDQWMEFYERMGTKFDYNSIMIYPPQAFALDPEKGSLKTLTDFKINPSKDQLSREDRERLRFLYGR